MTAQTHSKGRFFSRGQSEPNDVVGARYEVLNELGHGGYGVVYRALDRLTGRVVTVKRMCFESRSQGSSEARSTLAEEFNVLAGLRHANVITVLDYGFSDDGGPYLVMDLQEHAVTILEASAGQPLAIQVDFLVQTLRALHYMHRVGILHRDLKPANVLVVRGVVKVLDFGLSLRRGSEADQSPTLAGSPGYIAPEVLRGEAPTEQSDFYSLGVIAYEMIVGRPPFEWKNGLDLQAQASKTLLPRPTDAVPPVLRPILEKLLHPKASERYSDAGGVIEDLGRALNLPLATETVATRESLLQAAPFIGREHELETLYAALRAAGEGQEAMWWVAGESGVGKSRLLDELRTRALVDGFIVLRGQTVDRGGGPHHVWRLIVSHLLLWTGVSQTDAEVLKQVVPDIERLLGNAVGDPPPLDPDGTQTRLMLAVEALLRQQTRPVLILLEDFHWAGSESLKLLAWLAQSTSPSYLLLVASFRDDEMPGLAASIPGARVLKLERLSADASSALAEKMIGPRVCQPEVLEFLQREAEGIPFFIVELVRALAEVAGSLDRIGRSALPEHLLPGGIRQIVQRRIEYLSREECAALRTAAVIGREIDSLALKVLHQDLNYDDWISACARNAVLDIHEGRWAFAHDKLREQLLAELTPEVRQDLHRQVALAIEQTHTQNSQHLAALAYHWKEAGDAARESHYAREAGLLALRSGAAREAVELLTRALETHRSLGHEASPRIEPRRRAWVDTTGRIDPGAEEFSVAQIEGALCEAYFRLGDMTACKEQARRALALFGCTVPQSTIGFFAATLGEVAVRVLQRLLRVRSKNPEAALRVAAEAGRVQLRLTEVYFYSLRTLPIVWSALRIVNQCEPAGPSAPLAQGYAVLSILAGSARALRLGDSWSQRALRIASQTGVEQIVAWVQSRGAVYRVVDCRWEEIDPPLADATRTAERVGDVRLWTETWIIAANEGLYRADYEKALAAGRQVESLSRRSGNQQGLCWALLVQAALFIRRGQADEAETCSAEGLRLADGETMKSEAICALCGLALARFLKGDDAGAFEAAEHALVQTRATKPVAYWLQAALALLVEALLSLQEKGWTPAASSTPVSKWADEAVEMLRRFAQQIPLARPHAHLWSGLAAQLAGKQTRATREWQKAVSLGSRFGLPYEVCRANFEIGRHLPASNQREAYLREARAEFQRLGCAADLARMEHLAAGSA